MNAYYMYIGYNYNDNAIHKETQTMTVPKGNETQRNFNIPAQNISSKLIHRTKTRHGEIVIWSSN